MRAKCKMRVQRYKLFFIYFFNHRKMFDSNVILFYFNGKMRSQFHLIKQNSNYWSKTFWVVYAHFIGDCFDGLKYLLYLCTHKR